MPIRVLLVDDNDALRAALRTVVDGQDDFEVVADAASVADGVAAASQTEPDVVLMDVDLPDGRGPDAVTAIRAGLPAVGVVYFSGEDLDEDLRRAVGEDQFLSKSSSAEEILAAIRRAGPAPALPLTLVSPPGGDAPLLAGLMAQVAQVSVEATASAAALAGGPRDAETLAALLQLSAQLAQAQRDLSASLADMLAQDRQAAPSPTE